MSTNRLEAFSDGVLAIIITIMVLKFEAPEGHNWAALAPLWPLFATHVLSFIYLAIYWSNHHHMLHATKRVNGSVLWANLHLLFWLSFIPFVTGWMGESDAARLPTALYGTVLLLSSLAWMLLQWTIVADDNGNAKLRDALGRDLKGKASCALYAAAILIAVYQPWVSICLYAAVAVIWLIPDRRFEVSRNAEARSPEA